MTACTATRHGTEGAYRNSRCRCPAAREAHRLVSKRRREGRHQPARIDRTGTARRLRGLAALGWPRDLIATQLGCSVRTLRTMQAETDPRGRAAVHRATAARVAALYDRLSGTPGPSTPTRRAAHDNRWPSPLLWDGIDIDDPTATPHADEPAPPGYGTPRIDLAEVDYLTSWGIPVEQAAARLGVRPESIAQAQRRADARNSADAALPGADAA